MYEAVMSDVYFKNKRAILQRLQPLWLVFEMSSISH